MNNEEEFEFPNILQFNDGQEAIKWFVDNFKNGKEECDYIKETYEKIDKKVYEQLNIPSAMLEDHKCSYNRILRDRYFDWKGNKLNQWESNLLHIFERHICNDYIEEYHISTVWLGFNHGWFGKILLFETMVFCNDENNEWHEYQERYETLEEAQVGHKKICDAIQNQQSVTFLELENDQMKMSNEIIGKNNSLCR